MGYYSNEVLATLILMVVTQAARVLTVKIYFQIGYDDPFLGSILVLLGQSLALPIYYGVKWLVLDTDEGIAEGKSDAETGGGAKAEDATNVGENWRADTDLEGVVTGELATANVQGRPLQALGRMLVHTEWRSDSEDEREQDGDASRSSGNVERIAPSVVEKESSAQLGEGETDRRKLWHIGSGRGSFKGLTQQSQDAVQWVHKIPGWAKPLVSSFFNLLDELFMTLSILYLAASVATMLLGGMELVLSILAAKFVRKRHIVRQRWYGAGIMTIGLVLVACSDLVPDDNSDSSSESLGMGILFLFLKVVTGVSQNMTRELFIQEGNISATWLLGMEGSSGLLMAIPLYFLIGPLVGYNPVVSFWSICESSFSIGYTVGLIFALFAANIYSILGIAATSSMTSSMWKNFSGLVVWIVAMVIYYAVGDEDLGESWTIPGSFMILAGFSVMLTALHVYYREIK